MSPAAGANVARKRKKEGQGPAPKLTTAKVEEALLRRAKVVATLRGLDLHAYLDSLLRPLVDRDYREAISQEGKR
jgi:hypothetical protein